MRRTTSNRESKKPKAQQRLPFTDSEPAFEPETITRYRVALVREESTPYDEPQSCSDPSPSAEDLAFIHRMAEAGEIVGVRVLDHIVVGEAPAFESPRQRAGGESRRPASWSSVPTTMRRTV